MIRKNTKLKEYTKRRIPLFVRLRDSPNRWRSTRNSCISDSLARKTTLNYARIRGNKGHHFFLKKKHGQNRASRRFTFRVRGCLRRVNRMRPANVRRESRYTVAARKLDSKWHLPRRAWLPAHFVSLLPSTSICHFGAPIEIDSMELKSRASGEARRDAVALKSAGITSADFCLRESKHIQ